MVILCYYLVIQAFSNAEGWDELKSETAGGVIKKPITNNPGVTAIALAAASDLYFVASILNLHPWYMTQNFLQ